MADYINLQSGTGVLVLPDASGNYLLQSDAGGAAAVVAPGMMGMGNQFVAWHAGTIDPTMHKIEDGISA